jgi:hypothetical protein
MRIPPGPPLAWTELLNLVSPPCLVLTEPAWSSPAMLGLFSLLCNIHTHIKVMRRALRLSPTQLNTRWCDLTTQPGPTQPDPPHMFKKLSGNLESWFCPWHEALSKKNMRIPRGPPSVWAELLNLVSPPTANWVNYVFKGYLLVVPHFRSAGLSWESAGKGFFHYSTAKQVRRKAWFSLLKHLFQLKHHHLNHPLSLKCFLTYIGWTSSSLTALIST